MLSRIHRLTSGREFAEAVRDGRRAGGQTVVLHLGVASGQDDVPARVGFVVGKAVGPAVTRNLVKRRLRHLARERVGVLPPQSVLVVRALPQTAGASYREIADDFDASLHRLRNRETRPGRR